MLFFFFFPSSFTNRLLDTRTKTLKWQHLCHVIRKLNWNRGKNLSPSLILAIVTYRAVQADLMPLFIVHGPACYIRYHFSKVFLEEDQVNVLSQVPAAPVILSWWESNDFTSDLCYAAILFDFTNEFTNLHDQCKKKVYRKIN